MKSAKSIRYLLCFVHVDMILSPRSGTFQVAPFSASKLDTATRKVFKVNAPIITKGRYKFVVPSLYHGQHTALVVSMLPTGQLQYCYSV